MSPEPEPEPSSSPSSSSMGKSPDVRPSRYRSSAVDEGDWEETRSYQREKVKGVVYYSLDASRREILRKTEKEHERHRRS